MTFFNIRTEVRGSCPRGEAHVGRGKPRQRWALGGSAAPGASPTRRRSAATAGPEAMPPRRSPRLVEDLKSSRAASQGNSRPANSSARAPKHDHPLGPIAKGSLILPKIESKIGRPPSCWNLEHACPCPESDFFSTPPPPQEFSHRRRMRGGDGGSALACGLSESEHIGMLNYKIHNGSALPQRVLRDPGVVPRRKNRGCEYAHHLETI